MRIIVTSAGWDGETIPESGRCGPPALRVEDIPPGAEDLLLAFDDRDRGRTRLGYRAPCGGGDGVHRYEVVVTAMAGSRVVDSGVLALGSLGGVPGWVVDLG